jgi:hypothetical protein
MNTLLAYAFILTLIFFSCNGKKEQAVTNHKFGLNEKQKSISIPDTTKKFVVDEYIVTNEMLEVKKKTHSSYKIQSGKTFSYDKVWFSNDSINQVLVFELYTDFHRLVTYHFYENDLPADLINRMELHTKDGKIALDKQKRKDFNGFLKQSNKINSNYFITKKGFKLGDTKQKAIENYCNPDKQASIDGIEKLEWMFVGDVSYDGKTDLKGKPLAAKSFGHHITMYFRKGKLIGQILHNDIP